MSKHLANMRPNSAGKVVPRSRPPKSGRVNSMADLVADRAGRREQDVIDRFWNYVDMRGKDQCWGWTGTANERGYGVLSVGDRNRAANRIAWLIHKGPIPDGMFVCHTCDNPPCTNPDHLFLGTAKENIQDMVSKGRGAFGESSGTSKLSLEDVKEIIRRRASGEMIKSIAASYGVYSSCICKICKGQRWTTALANQ